MNTSEIIDNYIKDFKKNKKPIEINFRKIIPIQNLDRLTHFIHPYPAKLLQHIPIFFLSNDILSNEGDIVFDPFCGSGTVTLEAAIRNRIGYGTDINPFAVLLSKVKCTKIDTECIKNDLLGLIDEYNSCSNINHDVVNSEYWYSDKVRSDLSKLSNSLYKVSNETVRNFFRICLSYTARKMSYADPRISVPVRVNPQKHPYGHKLREAAQKHLKSIENNTVIGIFNNIVSINTKKIADLNKEINFVQPDFRELHAMQLNKCIDKNSVQLIITSPPYPGAQKYIRSCSLSLGWLKLCATSNIINLKKNTIGREEISEKQYVGDYKDKKILSLLQSISKINPRRAAIAETYLKEMDQVLKNCNDVLKNQGWLILIAANNLFCGKDFLTQEYIKDIALKYNFTLKAQFIDDIASYGLMTKRNKTAGIISCEWVHVFQKG